MDSQKQFLLVYHQVNGEEARSVESFLSPAGYEFESLSGADGTMKQYFAHEMQRTTLPAVFLISDNFLKSKFCLFNLLSAVKSKMETEGLICILCPGKVFNAEKNLWEIVETDFNRVSGIIKYINFWQDSYLDLRSRKRQQEESGDAEALKSDLKIIRNISTEIGELLRLINESKPLKIKDLVEQNFEPFFVKTGEEGKFETYLKALALAAEEEIATDNKKTSGKDEALDFENLSELDSKNISRPLKVEQGSAKQAINRIAAHPEIIEKASRAFENAEFVAGMNILETHLEKHPDDEASRFQLAAAQVSYTQDFKNAEENLGLLLEQNPVHTEAAFLMAELAASRGNLKSAESHFLRVSKLQPDYPDIFYRLALLALKTENDKKKALKFFKKAAKANPQNHDALYRYACLLDELKGNYWKSVEYFEKVLDLEPNHPFANYDLAVIYHRLGDRKKANAFYQKAYAINPEIKTAENDLAFSYESVEDDLNSLVEPEDTMPTKVETSSFQPSPTRSEERVVLITGATSGIGLATAGVFAQNGYRLILSGRRKDRLDHQGEMLRATFQSDIHTLNFDVRDLAAVEKALDELPAEWREIDILINNAGLAKGLAPIHQGDFDHWETMIDTNLKGLLYMTRLIAPWMVRRKSGHIINVCSTAGKEVYPNGNVYCATKFAVDALTKAMRLDLYQHNIRVSQVSPGHVEETEFALVRFDGNEEKSKIYNDFNPLTSRDVAETIYFIATRPAHVNIQDVLMMGTQQAASTHINRSGRK